MKCGSVRLTHISTRRRDRSIAVAGTGDSLPRLRDSTHKATAGIEGSVAEMDREQRSLSDMGLAQETEFADALALRPIAPLCVRKLTMFRSRLGYFRDGVRWVAIDEPSKRSFALSVTWNSLDLGESLSAGPTQEQSTV